MPRHRARRWLHLVRKYKTFGKALLSLVHSSYSMIYVGDKPGEGTNIGCGLVNCVEEVERAD